MPKELSFIKLQPPVWARNAHLQTIWGDKLPSAKLNRPSFDFWVHLKDKDRLLIREYSPTVASKPKLVLLAHGLSGNSEAGYMQRIAGHCLDRGYQVALMNHRNCGDSFGTSKGPYHSGRGDDIGAVIAALRKRWPKHEIIVAGFSMSGNALLRLVAEHMGPEPDRVIAVNPPINLSKCSDLINQGFSRVYEINFLLAFDELLKKKQKQGLIEHHYPVKPFRMKIRQFDDLYTGPRGGFGEAQDYYRLCSTHEKLHQIQVPTFILSAEDDPFIDAEDFKVAAKKLQGAPVHIHVEKFGGHLGYLHKEKTPLGTNRWMDYAVMEMIEAEIGTAKNISADLSSNPEKTS